MTLSNPSDLTIRVRDFNLVVRYPNLLRQLRELTLEPYSGMNYELNRLQAAVATRPVRCQVLMAYCHQNLVGWALLSWEPTDYSFARSPQGYNSGMGVLFEVFVHQDYRRQGIASKLIQVARRKTNGSRLCVCPWDYNSRSFFNNFSNYNNREL